MVKVVKAVEGYQMGTTLIKKTPEGYELVGDPVDLNVDKVDGFHLVGDPVDLNVDKVDGFHLPCEIPNTIANILTNHNASNHPISILKIAEGSFSQVNVPADSYSNAFAISLYSHPVQIRGYSTDDKVTLANAQVTGTTYTANYKVQNNETTPHTVYARWQYHSSSKQAIWGIWNKEIKRLSCVLIEEDEGYCKLYAELKIDEILVKFKDPDKFLSDNYDSNIDLSKSQKDKEAMLKEKSKAGYILEHIRVKEENFELIQ